jgi:hypothetical protein
MISRFSHSQFHLVFSLERSLSVQVLMRVEDNHLKINSQLSRDTKRNSSSSYKKRKGEKRKKPGSIVFCEIF